MNQRLWSGFTAALLVTAVAHASSSHAETPSSVPVKVGNTTQASEDSPQIAVQPTAAEVLPSAPEAIKVGEYQSCSPLVTTCTVAAAPTEEAIAKIHAHEIEGRSAATLYVRNIPILTFLGSRMEASNPSPIKVGEIEDSTSSSTSNSTFNSSSNLEQRPSSQHRKSAQNSEIDQYSSDPVWRATALAAKVNQLYRERMDGTKIAVHWQSDRSEATTAPNPAIFNRLSPSEQPDTPSSQAGSRFLIKVDGEDLIAIDANTRLPDTTRNLAEDALQVTNRLRRQLGAPPLREIEGRPLLLLNNASTVSQPSQPLARLQGWASWYGPGFHGLRSASGEVFNQDALTAAHRSLPFGTLIRVTNLDNGLSVVVRINDRGPFSGGRILDLSAAAARVVGLIQAGVAPVQVEVLGQQNLSERSF